MFIKTLCFSLSARVPTKKPAIIVRTWFDRRCVMSGGGLRDEYFGPLAQDLKAKYPTLFVFKLIHSSFSELQDYLKARRDPEFCSCLVESFLSPVDVLKVFFSFMFSRIRVKGSIFYKNIDISWLLNSSLEEDHLMLRGLVFYIELVAAKKILKLCPEVMLIPHENQAWEKAYPFARHLIPKCATKITGYQHTGFSLKILNYFPTRTEAGMPVFPDKLVTVGGITKRVLEEKAHYPCPIVEGASLRFDRHARNGTFSIEPANTNILCGIVYAFSYDIPKYRKIVESLIDVFQDSRVKVFLKIHPLYDEGKVFKDLGIRLPDNFILAQKIPWDDIYRTVDCILYDDNSIGLEGMIHGLKTYMLDEGDPVYDCNRMYYFDLWNPTMDIRGLRALKDIIESGSFNKGFDRGKALEYINSYYNVYSKDKYFDVYL